MRCEICDGQTAVFRFAWGANVRLCRPCLEAGAVWAARQARAAAPPGERPRAPEGGVAPTVTAGFDGDESYFVAVPDAPDLRPEGAD